MVIDIKMCRFESVPWGFRLVGGADYDYPLTVVKVSEGSIAENAGLKVDDVIVRINDEAASPLSHEEANQVIRHCGNVFYFGVFRENEEIENVQPKFPIKINEPLSKFSSEDTSMSSLPELEPEPNPNEDFRDNLFIPELPDRPCSVLSESLEIKLVEEEIAAVLSGESEVLKEHNVLGIFPKPGVCMASDVLRTLNEDAIKTQAEKVKELRKWSTFLQKPNRPVPKSKLQLEAERRAANAYKVKIVKSAPRTEKSKSPMPEGKEVEVEKVAASPKPPSPSPPPQPKEATPPTASVEESAIEEEPPLEDSEVPNLEEIPQTPANGNEVAATNGEDTKESSLQEREVGEEEQGNVETTTESDSAKEVEIVEQSNDIEATLTPPTQEKTEEELILEKQLADVQKQLAALSSLPSTIKSTLDAVTKQLAEILPTFKLEPIQLDVINESEKTDANEKADDNCSVIEKKGEQDAADTQLEECVHSEVEDDQRQQSRDDSEVELISQNVKQRSPRPPQEQETEEQSDTGDEKITKKIKKHDVIDELEEHFGRQSNRKRSKRAFGPLTPSSERPLVLPGGRRWYRPKDAYNDEFIAETLSAQAELITGTTLGCTFESSLLGYDSRVNFMKYQKPERKIDLDRSEVYKVIHHLDRRPVRGIEVRPPLVAAEDDIRKSIKS